LLWCASNTHPDTTQFRDVKNEQATVHKQTESNPNKTTIQRLRAKPHHGCPTISRFERRFAHDAPAWVALRQVSLLDAIEERFSQIFITDLVDNTRRAAQGDSDHLNEQDFRI
jgi:hypothetical protein